MKKLFFLLAFVLGWTSCQDQDVLQGENERVEENRYPYAISEEEALLNLKDFLSESSSNHGTQSTRASHIASIIPVKYKRFSTRAESSAVTDCENLVYVVNFEDNEGYAILAADSRISSKVIAITDCDEMEDHTIYYAADMLDEEDHEIYNDYPQDGDGFIYVPEYDETFMNPNTVDLYNSEEEDTLVGTLDLSDDDAETETLSTRSSFVAENPIKVLSAYLCMAYALNEVSTCGEGATWGDNDENDEDDDEEHDGTNEEDVDDEWDEKVGVGNSNGSSSGTTRTETSYGEWSTKKSVAPLLATYVGWVQTSPFNDLCPKRRKYILFGNKKRASAGCFPLSLAKLLTYYKYPSVYQTNGVSIDWNELNMWPLSDKGKESASYLLKSIGSACDSWYFYNGTFTFPSKVTSFMRTIGISESHSRSYSFERVTNMIDQEAPVIIYSIPHIDIANSHAWNIDGYKIKSRTVTTKTYKDDSLQKSIVTIETSEMVHCDFGWKGLCNGYYVSGVFKLNNSEIERDPNFGNGKSTHFKTLLKLITYTKP